MAQQAKAGSRDPEEELSQNASGIKKHVKLLYEVRQRPVYIFVCAYV
jgi:hypothetical protein